MLYLWLYPLHTDIAIFNVFRYLSFRMIYAALTAFVLAFVLAPPLIKKLQALGLGQRIREEGPRHHQAKQGTPTMGGILIIFAVLLSTLLWADVRNLYVWLVVLSIVGFGLIGFIDDYIKISRGRSEGLSVLQKFVTQIAIALGIGLFFLYVSRVFDGTQRAVFQGVYARPGDALHSVRHPGDRGLLQCREFDGRVGRVGDRPGHGGVDGVCRGGLCRREQGNFGVSVDPVHRGCRGIGRADGGRFPDPVSGSCGSTRIRRRCSWGTWGLCPSARPWARSPWSASMSCC